MSRGRLNYPTYNTKQIQTGSCEVYLIFTVHTFMMMIQTQFLFYFHSIVLARKGILFSSWECHLRHCHFQILDIVQLIKLVNLQSQSQRASLTGPCVHCVLLWAASVALQHASQHARSFVCLLSTAAVDNKSQLLQLERFRVRGRSMGTFMLISTVAFSLLFHCVAVESIICPLTVGAWACRQKVAISLQCSLVHSLSYSICHICQ